MLSNNLAEDAILYHLACLRYSGILQRERLIIAIFYRTPLFESDIILRDVAKEDLPIFFEQQLDPVSNYMAAFTSKDPSDKNAFTAHWAKILADRSVTMKTTICEGSIIGSVGSFHMFGQHQVTYWTGREYWGKGLATKALSKFLKYDHMRPIYGRAAKDNIASIRVLEKCGFTLEGYEKGFANARGTEIEEIIMKLEPER